MVLCPTCKTIYDDGRDKCTQCGAPNPVRAAVSVSWDGGPGKVVPMVHPQTPPAAGVQNRMLTTREEMYDEIVGLVKPSAGNVEAARVAIVVGYSGAGKSFLIQRIRELTGRTLRVEKCQQGAEPGSIVVTSMEKLDRTDENSVLVCAFGAGLNTKSKPWIILDFPGESLGQAALGDADKVSGNWSELLLLGAYYASAVIFLVDGRTIARDMGFHGCEAKERASKWEKMPVKESSMHMLGAVLHGLKAAASVGQDERQKQTNATELMTKLIAAERKLSHSQRITVPFFLGLTKADLFLADQEAGGSRPMRDIPDPFGFTERRLTGVMKELRLNVPHFTVNYLAPYWGMAADGADQFVNSDRSSYGVGTLLQWLEKELEGRAPRWRTTGEMMKRLSWLY